MKVYTPGTLIVNRYEIASRPMMGGMGIVYFCLDHQEDRPVALKTFKSEYMPDRAARDRFLREGTHWIDLGAHPHIVRCYGVEYVNNGLEVYLVLELVTQEQSYPDASLRSWLIPDQPLPIETALLFALQIARGMQHAVEHLPGFVHRDLKPENVLVGADKLPGCDVNRLRVTDFGLATLLKEAGSKIGEAGSEAQPVPASGIEIPASRTQLTHGIVGTPLYMAPEQWRGESVDIYTDVYALGCILYEMLTGQWAVSGHNLAALERAHCEGAFRSLPTSLPETVRACVLGFLAREPNARYTTWDAAETAITRAYQDISGQTISTVMSGVSLGQVEQVAHGWSYNALGLSYLDLGKATVAVGYFERAKVVGTETETPALHGGALSNLGIAYAKLGELKRAVGHFEQCLVLYRQIGNRRGEGAVLGNLGLAHMALGDPRHALEYQEQSLEIAREIGNRYSEGASLGNLGNIYESLGEMQRAIDYYQQDLEIACAIGDKQGEGAALGGLGNTHFKLGEVKRAVDYFEQALETAREISDWSGEKSALNNLGLMYAYLGDKQRAIDCHEQALKMSHESSDRKGESYALNNLGLAYKNLGKIQCAIGYYEQALEIAREIGDRYNEGNAVGNLGNAYYLLGEMQRAISYHEQVMFSDTKHAE